MGKPVLETPTLQGYKFPDIERFFPDDWEANTREKLAKFEDFVTVGGIGDCTYMRSWQLRGTENVLMDVIAEPAFYEDLVNAITEHQLELLDRLIELPFDGIFFSDDWCDQNGVTVGPDRWREFIKPCTAKLYKKVKDSGKLVFNHVCGSVEAIIPDLI